MPAPDYRFYDNWRLLFLIQCWIGCFLRYLANSQSQYVLERVVYIRQIEIKTHRKLITTYIHTYMHI